MADVLIVGDGPGGLSAALFLAKNGLSVTVIGKDETLMHKALLYNYLGIPKITGSDLMAAARTQVEGFGAKVLTDSVTAMVVDGEAYAVTVEGGETHTGRYLILAMGSKRALADGLQLDRREDGTITVDLDQRTSLSRCSPSVVDHRPKTRPSSPRAVAARAAPRYPVSGEGRTSTSSTW